MGKGFRWVGRAALAAAILLSGVGADSPPQPASPSRFTAETITRDAPEGLVSEIDLYQGGGSYPGCMRLPEFPELNYMPGDLELMDIAMISTCGWEAGETITVTLREPTGKLQTFTAKAVPAKNYPAASEVTIYFQPPVSAPEGKYRFTFAGSRGEVKAKIQFDRPDGARLFALPSDAFHPAFEAGGKQHRLMLSGFLPQEPVRLMAYRFEGTRIHYVGMQDYLTDGRGELVVEVNLPELPDDARMNYYAYGRETHTVPIERFTADGFSASDVFSMDLYCPGAKTPRARSLSSVRVLAKPVKIVQVPGFGSRVTIEAPPAAELYIFGQPKCIDHAFWWQARLLDPLRFGWVSETAPGGAALLEPITPTAEK
jgi:hypothetical protein